MHLPNSFPSTILKGFIPSELPLLLQQVAQTWSVLYFLMTIYPWVSWPRVLMCSVLNLTCSYWKHLVMKEKNSFFFFWWMWFLFLFLQITPLFSKVTFGSPWAKWDPHIVMCYSGRTFEEGAIGDDWGQGMRYRSLSHQSHYIHNILPNLYKI